MSEKVLIEVFDGSLSAGCNCSGCASRDACGPQTEALTGEMREDLARIYGDKVEVRYINTDQEGLTNFKDIWRVIQNGYPFPIISVNGTPRLAGGVDAKKVRALIDEAIGKGQV